jgi:hypothetical protein
MSRDELNYPAWQSHRLAARIRLYAGYVGCCCRDGKHSRSNPSCARADFQRMARELCQRNPRP